MPRLRRPRFENRRRTAARRDRDNARLQAEHQGAQANDDPPNMPALNDGGDLQLQQVAVINPEAQQGAAHLQGPEDHDVIEVEPIPAPPPQPEDHDVMDIDPMPSPPPQPQLPEDEDMIDEEPHQFPPPHRLGQMNNTCPNCGAKYFQEEVNSQGVFTKCCYRGAITLPPIQPPSINILQLFNGDTANSRHFLQNIRHYNAAMAMASWNATLNEHAGRGPRVVTIHGQSYHLTAAQEAQQGQQAQYAQLYILDTTEAMHQRVNDPRNQNLLQDVIQIVQDELMAVNPYARQYHNMGEVLQRERQLAAANNQPIAPVRMIIATRPFQDRRYNNPTASEIAAVYVGDDGAAPNPQQRDIEIYPADRLGNNTTKIKV